MIEAPKWHRTILLPIYGISLLGWAVLPLLVLAFLLVSQPWSEELLEMVGPGTLYAWAVSFVFAFGIMCFFLLSSAHRAKRTGTHQNPHQTRHQVVSCLLGILCTITLGLPAILFGVLPYMVSGPDILQGFYSQGNTVDLSGGKSIGSTGGYGVGVLNPGIRKPLNYVVLVDVSQSFMDDKKAELVGRVLSNIFSTEGVIGRTRQNADGVEVWFFAGQCLRRYIKNLLDGSSSQDLREAMSEARIIEQLKDVYGGRADFSYQTQDTDLLRVIGKVYDQAEAYQNQYAATKIVLLSDLEQSTSEGSMERDKRALNKLVYRARRMPFVSLVALHSKARVEGAKRKDSEAGGAEFSIASKFGEIPEQWQLIDLEHYSNCSKAEKFLLMYNLFYTLESPSRALYLKFLGPFSGRPLRSFVKFPQSENEDDEDVVFHLRFLPNQGSSFKIRLGGDKEDAFTLSPGEEEFYYWTRRASSSNPLPVELFNQVGAPTLVTPELMVAIPARSVVYRIPLRIMSANNADWLWCLFLILNAVPLIIAVLEWLHAYDYARAKPVAQGEVEL